MRRRREVVGRCGRHLCTALRPVDEGIAAVGRRRQRDGGACIVRARAVDRAARGRLRTRRNCVLDAEEVRHQVAVRRCCEGVGRCGPHRRAPLGPVDKGEAAVSRRRQCDGVACIVRATFADHATLRWGGTRHNRVLNAAEVRHQCLVHVGGKAVFRLVPNHLTRRCPVDKLILWLSGCVYRRRLTIIHHPAAAHRPAVAGFGPHANRHLFRRDLAELRCQVTVG